MTSSHTLSLFFIAELQHQATTSVLVTFRETVQRPEVLYLSGASSQGCAQRDSSILLWSPKIRSDTAFCLQVGDRGMDGICLDHPGCVETGYLNLFLFFSSFLPIRDCRASRYIVTWLKALQPKYPLIGTLNGRLLPIHHRIAPTQPRPQKAAPSRYIL